VSFDGQDAIARFHKRGALLIFTYIHVAMKWVLNKDFLSLSTFVSGVLAPGQPMLSI
jgi:hypothetical protein